MTQPTASSQPPRASATADIQTAPAILVQPDKALADETVSVKVVGLEAGQVVTVTASMSDDAGREWESWARFTAGEAGLVDLASQAPITGTYRGVDPMGLLWSMAPDVPAGTDQPYFANGLTGVLVATFMAETAEGDFGPAYLRRIRLPDSVQSTILSVDEHGFVGTFYLPEGAGPFPALLVLGGSGGAPDLPKAALLAAHGYATLAVTYFGRPPLPNVLAEIPLEYFETAIDWLQAHESVDAGKIGVLGSSRGGELALLLGATYPQLKAVVSYVGSGVVFPGYTRNPHALRPAWTYQGTPVPYSLSPEDADQATIAVERIKGPVLLISGEDDLQWPSTLLSDIAIARLEQFEHPYPFQHLAYEGASHFIGIPYLPSRGEAYTHPVSGVRYPIGGTPQDTARASAESWDRLLAFLESTFR
jgi:dienelactone hydrolase